MAFSPVHSVCVTVCLSVDPAFLIGVCVMPLSVSDNISPTLFWGINKICSDMFSCDVKSSAFEATQIVTCDSLSL